MRQLKNSDPRIFEIIQSESLRQSIQLQMIPSENYASAAVREAVGSVLMNKYSEGQVKKRYYQGNKYIDEVEQLCKDRAMKAFRLDPEEWGVNVQALSGTPANVAVLTGLLEPGEKIMAMYLPDGGHLSHGWMFKDKKITFTSKVFQIEYYHVDPKTKVFDYDQVEQQAKRYKPKMLIAGGTAYPREINHKRMGEIARKVGAYYLADIAHEAGLVAGGANTSPFPYAHVVTMTTHKTLRGPRGAIIFARKDLIETINKSVFPGLQGGPHNHTIAGITVALGEVLKPSFKTYTKQVVKNAQVLAKELTRYGYDLVSGGTDKHLILIDLRKQGISGVIPAKALEVANIIVNFNTVPYDSASPMYPSGLRLGTPAITTRGMKEKEMKQIARWIYEVIDEVSEFKLPTNPKERRIFIRETEKKLVNNKKLLRIGAEVKKLTQKFPVP
ncbi:serine hydroxymethyltransferase [Candidatus Roizmanbacteria bacterium]|nr:serine hydroxymethyltransferase [Candidatus Roizmanbacteria bacterium]